MMDDKEHQWHDFPELPNLTMLPWLVWALVIVLAIGGALYAGRAVAEPMFQVRQGDVVITLHSEECTLKEVSNLPNRATWTEGGKVFEGCFGIQPAMKAVMMFFTDKSVAVAPASIFTRIVGA
jgi:uncharacterized protein (DUF1501 family)